MGKLLVTGATGFLGSSLVEHLLQHRDCQIVAAVRRCGVVQSTNITRVEVGDISVDTDWTAALEDVDVVVHLAARAHVMSDSISDPLSVFRRTNVDGTFALANQASEAGVKRFIFTSSIGVHGSNSGGSIFDEEVDTKPRTDYGHSKWEAEQCLLKIASETGLDVVIVRPPMVVAGHAPGNLRRLMNITSKGIPLPLASVHNQRSLVALDNLVDFLAVCIDHPAAANQTFVISDNDDVSTPEIIKYLTKGMGKRAMLVPFPVGVLSVMAKALRKEPMFTQLCGSLRIDCSKARNLLGWKPKVSARDALTQAGSEFIKSTSG